jgi:hypothetical protein
MPTQNNSSLRPSWIRQVALALILCVGCNSLVPSLAASPVSSATMVAGTNRTADLASIQLALEHKVVKQRLGELGFTSAEITQRLEYATDAELHQLASQSESVMAGGFIIGVLLVVLLVIVILRVAAVDTVLQPTAVAA